MYFIKWSCTFQQPTLSKSLSLAKFPELNFNLSYCNLQFKYNVLSNYFKEKIANMKYRFSVFRLLQFYFNNELWVRIRTDFFFVAQILWKRFPNFSKPQITFSLKKAITLQCKQNYRNPHSIKLKYFLGISLRLDSLS